jgi:hypothetical protein
MNGLKPFIVTVLSNRVVYLFVVTSNLLHLCFINISAHELQTHLPKQKRQPRVFIIIGISLPNNTVENTISFYPTAMTVLDILLSFMHILNFENHGLNPK